MSTPLIPVFTRDQIFATIKKKQNLDSKLGKFNFLLVIMPAADFDRASCPFWSKKISIASGVNAGLSGQISHDLGVLGLPIFKNGGSTPVGAIAIDINKKEIPNELQTAYIEMIQEILKSASPGYQIRERRR